MPLVLVFEPGVMSRCGGHIYEDVAGTVRANAGDNQQAVVYERRTDSITIESEPSNDNE